MSEWSTVSRAGLSGSKDVPYPNKTGDSFWDCGNNGITTDLCSSTTDKFGAAVPAAKLQSKKYVRPGCRQSLYREFQLCQHDRYGEIRQQIHLHGTSQGFARKISRHDRRHRHRAIAKSGPRCGKGRSRQMPYLRGDRGLVPAPHGRFGNRLDHGSLGSGQRSGRRIGSR